MANLGLLGAVGGMGKGIASQGEGWSKNLRTQRIQENRQKFLKDQYTQRRGDEVSDRDLKREWEQSDTKDTRAWNDKKDKRDYQESLGLLSYGDKLKTERKNKEDEDKRFFQGVYGQDIADAMEIPENKNADGTVDNDRVHQYLLANGNLAAANEFNRAVTKPNTGTGSERNILTDRRYKAMAAQKLLDVAVKERDAILEAYQTPPKELEDRIKMLRRHIKKYADISEPTANNIDPAELQERIKGLKAAGATPEQIEAVIKAGGNF